MAQDSSRYQQRNAYIPAGAKAAMDHHMQQSMPAHLRKYASGDRYIPQHAQAQIQAHMEKSVPKHLRQYAGAYSSQQAYSSNSRPVRQTADFQPVAPPTPYRPVTHLPRDSHYYQHGDPTQIQPGSQPAPTQSAQVVQPAAYSTSPGQQPQPPNPNARYDFIMNPGTETKRSFMANGVGRWLAILGALLLIFIVFAVVKNLLTPPSILPSYVSVAQDQQAMISIVGSAKNQNDLNTTNKNFIATAGLSLPSNQSELLKLLAEGGQKVNPKILGAKINPATSQKLAAAAAAENYNSVFKDTLQAQLTAYKAHMQQTYDKTRGGKARTLLAKQFKQAELLETQLNTSETSDETVTVTD